MGAGEARRLQIRFAGQVLVALSLLRQILSSVVSRRLEGEGERKCRKVQGTCIRVSAHWPFEQRSKLRAQAPSRRTRRWPESIKPGRMKRVPKPEPKDDVANEPETEAPDGNGTKPERTFGGLSAREAGLRSAQKRQERQLAQAEAVKARSDGRIVFVRVPVHLGDIVSALANGAAKGDAGQARELRSWMAEFPVDDSTDISALDRRTREALKARLLSELSPIAHSPIAPMETDAEGL